MKLIFKLLAVLRNNRRRGRQADESDDHQEEVHMTEAQKEEEAIIKTTFAFYEKNKGGTQIEIFELPMLLEGKSFLCRQTLCRQNEALPPVFQTCEEDLGALADQH